MTPPDMIADAFSRGYFIEIRYVWYNGGKPFKASLVNMYTDKRAPIKGLHIYPEAVQLAYDKLMAMKAIGKGIAYKMTYKDMYTGEITEEIVISYTKKYMNVYKFSESRYYRNLRKRLVNCNKLKQTNEELNHS